MVDTDKIKEKDFNNEYKMKDAKSVFRFYKMDLSEQLIPEFRANLMSRGNLIHCNNIFIYDHIF